MLEKECRLNLRKLIATVGLPVALLVNLMALLFADKVMLSMKVGNTILGAVL